MSPSAPPPTARSARPSSTAPRVVPSGLSHPRLRVARHAGREIIVFDLRDMQDHDEAVAIIEGPYRRHMDAQPPTKECLTLTDVRDTPASPRVTTAMREFANQNIPYVKAAAVVTASNLHRLAVSTIALFTKRKIRAFDDERAALDWLVAQ